MMKRLMFGALAAGVLALPVFVLAAPRTIDGLQKVSSPGFEGFDVYAVRVDEIGTGPDGEYQAVLTVKNKTGRAAGLVASHLQVALINAENEPRTSDGNLYEPDASGPREGLPIIGKTIVLAPNEQARVRVAFWRSKGFVPATLRVREYVNRESTVTYAIGAAGGQSASGFKPAASGRASANSRSERRSPWDIEVPASAKSQKDAFVAFGRVRCNDCEGGYGYDSWAQHFVKDWNEKLGALGTGQSLQWQGNAARGTVSVLSEEPVDGFRCKQLSWRLAKGSSSVERPGLMCWGRSERYSATESWVQVY